MKNSDYTAPIPGAKEKFPYIFIREFFNFIFERLKELPCFSHMRLERML